MNLNILLTLLDKPIVFHRPFLRIMNTNCALFLSQCLHWQRHTKYDGWFTHTIEQFQFETGLSRKEQLSIKKTLSSKNILKIERRGNPSKNWYTINLEELYVQLSEEVEKGDDKWCQKGTTSGDKKGRLVVSKGDDYINKEVIINSNNKKNINTKKSFINLSLVGISDCENVQLEQNQYDKLITDYPTDLVQTQIIQLDGYLEDHPKKYKSHYKALRSWLLKAQQKQSAQPKYVSAQEYNYNVIKKDLETALVEGNIDEIKPF